jgi:hypothetical protein
MPMSQPCSLRYVPCKTRCSVIQQTKENNKKLEKKKYKQFSQRRQKAQNAMLACFFASLLPSLLARSNDPRSIVLLNDNVESSLAALPELDAAC